MRERQAERRQQGQTQTKAARVADKDEQAAEQPGDHAHDDDGNTPCNQPTCDGVNPLPFRELGHGVRARAASFWDSQLFWKLYPVSFYPPKTQFIDQSLFSTAGL